MQLRTLGVLGLRATFTHISSPTLLPRYGLDNEPFSVILIVEGLLDLQIALLAVSDFFLAAEPTVTLLLHQQLRTGIHTLLRC